jgi:catalase
MEGFGVHTFRLVNAKGVSTLVKFHWKPVAGMASLIWEEAQKLGGIDPDFHRRDLFSCIEAGVYPEWDFGIQTLPDNEDQMFEGIDLLDPTKLVPEELAPVEIIGRLTLNRNPSNYFSETEQVAFCTSHIPRGIDFTDDPLLQARNFSYQDTQLTRLGGPNFDQIPINRPRSDVNTTQRDGFGQQAVFEGVAAYNPNSLGGGCPFPAGSQGLVMVPRHVQGKLERKRPVSFDDHFSQATLFWNSMSDIERDHIVGAFSFELGKCLSDEVRTRMLSNLSYVDAALTTRVAANLGVKAPRARKSDPSIGSSEKLSLESSPPESIAGRVIGIICADKSDSGGVQIVRAALEAARATVVVIGPRGGELAGTGGSIAVDKSAMTTQSVEYDALMVAGGPGAVTVGSDPYVALNLGEAFRHYKPIGAWGEGRDVLEACGLALDASGVVSAPSATKAFAANFALAVARHRHWDR